MSYRVLGRSNPLCNQCVSLPRFTILLHVTETTPGWRTDGHADQRTEQQTASPANDVAIGKCHWDWLFETEPDGNDENARSLLTWATDPLAEEGLDWTPRSAPAIQLPNHRRRYLDYEGELSGGRGSVCRIASGEYSVLTQTADEFEARIESAVPDLPKPSSRGVRFRQTDTLWRLQVDAIE